MKNRVQKHLIVVFTLLVGTFLAFNLSSADDPSVPKEGVFYTCPMSEHADVVMDKPGKCPKCGMNLVEKKHSTIKYVCPMKEDADVISDKPGKCPKCGMNLVRRTEDK